VYACCHNRPAPLGSIQTRSLRDILTGAVAEEFRRRSRSGDLECYRTCILLYKREEPPPGLTDKASYSDFCRLKVLFGELCNINCIMCWQDHRDNTSLSYELIKDRVDLTPFHEIDIQGGEPLAIRSAREFFKHATEHGKRVSFLTNGLLVNDDWARRIAVGSFMVHFSLNAATKETHESINRGSNWDKVWENIKRVKKFKSQLGSPVKIIGHMTIVERNLYEIARFIDTMHVEFDELNFCYDRRLPGYLRKIPEIQAEISGDLARLGEEAMSTVSEFGRARLRDLGLLK